jgi:type VI secretion system secreted protein Hcp
MAVDIFLKLDGIDGESQQKGYEKWIEIHSFSWGATNSMTHAHGGGGGAGKVSVHDISFTHAFDKASPALMMHCAQGKHIKSAIISARKAGGTQQDYLTYKLTDLLVSSYQSGGQSSDVPTEQVTLNFNKFEIRYLDQETGETEVASCPPEPIRFLEIDRK